MTSTTTKKAATKKPRRMAREPQAKPVSAQNEDEQPSDKSDNPAARGEAAKRPTKSAIIVGLLTRSKGATLQEMADATAWLPHTTRAALTGLKKKGFVITSEKVEGVRTYRAVDKVEPDKPLEGEDSPVAGS